MIRFFVILGLIFLGLRALKALFGPADRGGLRGGGNRGSYGPSTDANLPVTDEMLQDPHCGVYFPRKEGVPLNVRGETLYFCSTRCRDAYQQEGEQ